MSDLINMTKHRFGIQNTSYCMMKEGRDCRPATQCWSQSEDVFNNRDLQNLRGQ